MQTGAVPDRKTEKPAKKNLKKKIFLTLFIIINILAIAIPAILEFSNNKESLPFKQVLSAIGGNWYYLLAAIGCFLLAMFFESCKYDTMIFITTGRHRFITAFEVAALGKYYDFITPFGTGGQPFQIYYLNKRDLPPGAPGALPVMGYLSNQIAFIVVALGVFITNASVMAPNPGFMVPAYVGLFTYMIIPVMVILFSIMPVLTQKIVAFFIRVLGKIRIIKNPQNATYKALGHLQQYNLYLKQMNQNKGLYFSIFAYSVLFQIALNSIPFFVLCAFGTTPSFYDVFSLCVITYAAVSFVPTPGNGGAAEAMFMMIFGVLSNGVLFWGMLFWRILSYYAFIAVGGMVVLERSYFDQKKQKQIAEESN